MQDLKVSSIQTQLHWEDKEENLKMFDSLIKNMKEETDLILLPEMFSTGFTMQAEEFYEEMDGEYINWMKEMATLKDAAIAGSLIIKEHDKYYNRLVFVEPYGTIHYYNKRHLFSMGDEHKHYTAGEEKRIVTYREWNLNLTVCYDLRFPKWLRNEAQNRYDALIVLANWPEKRMEHWDALLKARAIENQCYVIGVNRIGEDGNGIPHVGHTSVYHPFGTNEYLSEQAEIHTHVLSAHELKLNRRQFPFLNDMD
jgi:omega-amidase